MRVLRLLIAYPYTLSVGKNVYKLSDQETPAKSAGRRMSVQGALFTTTNILKVETITAVN